LGVKNSLKILKWKSEAINRTDNTMVKKIVYKDNDLQNTTQITKYRARQTPQKNRHELMVGTL